MRYYKLKTPHCVGDRYYFKDEPVPFEDKAKPPVGAVEVDEDHVEPKVADDSQQPFSAMQDADRIKQGEKAAALAKRRKEMSAEAKKKKPTGFVAAKKK